MVNVWLQAAYGAFLPLDGEFFGQQKPLSGRHFLCKSPCINHHMHARLFMFIKTLVKSSLDNYVLPGTLTGSEILWLYVIQWKRDAASLIFASYFLSAHSLRLKSLSTMFFTGELEKKDGHRPVERS